MKQFCHVGRACAAPHRNPKIYGQKAPASRKQNRRSGNASAGASVIIAVALAMLCATPMAAGERPAHAARSSSVSEIGRLHRIRSGGETITEEGRATGTIPGRVLAHLVVGPEVEVTFTISTPAGTISGKGSGVPKGRSEEPSFAGIMTLTSGSGRYRHVHGRGQFYGTLNRSTYKMVVQTTGTLSY